MQESVATRRWRKVVEEHTASGLTTRAFAASRNINAGTLSWWRCRIRKLDQERQRATAFTVLSVLSSSTVVLVFDDHKAHIVVDEDTDLALLRRVVEAMT